MTRVKKYKRNEYIVAEGVWVRNPYTDAEPLDMNDMARRDMDTFLSNETQNLSIDSIKVDEFNNQIMENVVICSDGYGWRERQRILADIPNSTVKVVGVNGSLAKWEMVGSLSDRKRVMSHYLVNNPYQECMSYLPTRHRYYPGIVASTRTFSGFLKDYPEKPIFYRPTKDSSYSGIPRDGCMVLDDYRNPVCGAISYCVAKRAKKIVLLCCDESFGEARPAAERMPNGLYQYPQQIKSQRIIDAQISWLRAKGVKVADCSSGVEYKNATYIKVEEIPSFFKDE